MNKNKKIAGAVGIVCVLALALLVAVAINRTNDMIDMDSAGDMEEDELGAADTDTDPADDETSKSTYVVPPILPEKKEPAQVIADAGSGQGSKEARDVVETTDESGNITQRPNWEAQKELADGVDLEDPDTVPTYKNSENTGSSTSSGNTGGSGGSSSGSSGNANGSGSGNSSTDSGSSNSSTGSDSSTSSGGGGSNGSNNSGGSSSPKDGDTSTIDGTLYEYWQGFGWVKVGDGNVAVEVDAPTTGNKVGY